jgi:formate hydrogenlyase subunit 4
MTGADMLTGACQVAGGVALSPLVVGTTQQLKARLQGRRGPTVLQPYRELRRLWGKSAVTPSTAGPVYRLAPPLVAAATLLAILVVPVAGRAAPWGFGHDAVVLVGLLALCRAAIAAAAWDTGAGFGLMAASRDLTFAVFSEGVLLLIILLAAITAGGSTDLTVMSATASAEAAWRTPLHWCAALAFALFVVTEMGRQPVDNPDTHLELTMVHEGPLLEYAGRDLACLQWAAGARLWLMMMLGAELFLPSGGPFAARLVTTAGAAVGLCAAIAVTETTLAKMRILRVPLFVGGGGALCLVGLTSWFVQARP